MTRLTIIRLRVVLIASFFVITILSVIPMNDSVTAGINDKLNHILAFFVLAFLTDFSFPNSTFNLAKNLPLFFYGLSIEWVQYYIPFREFSLLDIAADVTGLLSYGILLPYLKNIPLLRNRWDTDKIT